MAVVYIHLVSFPSVFVFFPFSGWSGREGTGDSLWGRWLHGRSPFGRWPANGVVFLLEGLPRGPPAANNKLRGLSAGGRSPRNARGEGRARHATAHGKDGRQGKTTPPCLLFTLKPLGPPERDPPDSAYCCKGALFFGCCGGKQAARKKRHKNHLCPLVLCLCCAGLYECF